MTSNDLDLFVLSLVQAGLGTTYDLKSKAGLSVGSTSPILGRLERTGLIGAPKAGVRGTRRFSITKAGSKQLVAEWKQLLSRQPTDVDEILRITHLAWTMDSPDIASRFLETAAAGLEAFAATRRAEASQLQRTVTVKVGGPAYRWLRTATEAARLQAQAEALRHLGKEIKNKKNRNR
jgi:hypothetical protein